MADDELKPIYLVGGSDRPKVALAVSRLRARFEVEALEHLGTGEASGADAVAACNAMGLFGGGQRLVLVDGVERWKAGDAKAVAAYGASPAPGTVLALVASDELKSESPLAKACAKAGAVLAYDVPKRRLPEWVGEQLARRGAQADPAACRTLVELVGDDLNELASEIDKLATWAGGDPIAERDVRTLAGGRAETSVFELTDAWGRRDLAAALAACESLLERSSEPRARVLSRVAALLNNHVGRVRACQALAEQGVRSREAAGKLKMHPYAAEKAFAQAANFTVDELRDAVVRLAELDVALKGGSRLAGDLELERALVDVTRPEAADR